MGSSLHHRQGIGSYMEGLMRALGGALPKALGKWNKMAVHESRVLTRRLGAAMDLLDPVIPRRSSKRLAKALRTIRRRLGPTRDLDVMLDHLMEIREAGRHEAAIDWITDRLCERRRSERKKAGRKLSADDAVASLRVWSGLKARVCDAEEDLNSLLAQSLSARLTIFAEYADQVSAGVVSDGESLASAADPSHDATEDLHALRLAGKRLRYHLELAEAMGRAVPGDVRTGMKRMQDALGIWHDDLLLSEAILRHTLDEAIGLHHRKLHRQLLELSREIQERGDLAVANFAATWREIGGEVMRVIRQRFGAEDDEADLQLKIA